MVDFKKLVTKKLDINVADYATLFESLDRETSHIELRPAQFVALQTLSERRAERDLILKISTGAGKTSIGLLYLLSFMEELKQPVVYLCPTRQLVGQVYAEAQKLGVKSTIYPGGETYPHVDGTAGKAIILCTYDKLFNAKSTFDRSDIKLRPCALVLDDAHAGVEEIRDSFTLRVSNNELHRELLHVLDEPCSQFNSSIWREIVDGDPNRSMELPYWIWKPLLKDIEKIVASHRTDHGLQFVIPYLQNILRWCRCVVSGIGIEIVPEVLPVHNSQAYYNANHRLFMSATLADDSVLLRELGCDSTAANNPIIPKNDKGLGERMVLAPTLVDASLDRDWAMNICSKISAKLRVVVLAPSESKARAWEDVGAKVFLGDEVAKAIEDLRGVSTVPNFAVFVQRYDGVDLPDSACRVLVLDGLPLGEGIIDKYDSSISTSVLGARNRVVYRIEQGMGRAVRSHADYCVVILAGPELAHFVAKHDVLSAMNPGTRAQLELARELARIAMDDHDSTPQQAIVDMIRKCLNRDDGWKQFYNENIRNAAREDSGITATENLGMADAERKAFDAVLSNDPSSAVKILREAINNNISGDPYSTGWYLQRVANYMFEVDPAEALEVQRAAFEKNRAMICPPGVVKRPIEKGKFDVQARLLDWFKQFDNPNGTIASISELRTKLSYDSSPAIIEQALCDLAPLMGAEGSRPEKDYGEGPDDLWLWPEISLVIEAKNENQKSLHKKDAGQLLLSLQWFERTYENRGAPAPIVISKVYKVDRNSDFPNGTRVLLPEGMHNLLDNLESLFQRIISEPLLYSTPQSLATLQQGLKLAPNQFIKTYTVGVKEIKKSK